MLHGKRLAGVALPLALVVLAACHREPPEESPHAAEWRDPDGRFTVMIPGAPAPRDVQEITAMGTVNFKVYGVDAHPYHYRVSAFEFPQPVPGLTKLDVDGELAHSSGRAVARMQGTPEHETNVVVDGLRAKEVTFTFATDVGATGRGIQRTIVGESPGARYYALCLAPTDADFAPCQAFVASLHPRATR